MAINTTYYGNLKRRIEGVNSCAALQEVAAEAVAALTKQQEEVAKQLAEIAPMLALLQPPTANLGRIVTWITDFINGFLKVQIKPYYEYQAQLVELSAQLAEVISALNDAKIKFPSCSLTVPSLPPAPSLPPIGD